MRRLSLPAHEAASAVPPVRSPSPPAHETASAVPPVRRPGLPAHEAASAVPSRAQPKPSCSRDSLGSPSRAQTKPSCSRGSLGSPIPCAALAFLLTRRIKIRPSYVRGSLLRTRGLWNPFLSPGRIAGHSRVALWPYCHLQEEFRLCRQTEIGADELDF